MLITFFRPEQCVLVASISGDNLVPRVLSYPPHGARERERERSLSLSLHGAGRREPWERGCTGDWELPCLRPPALNVALEESAIDLRYNKVFNLAERQTLAVRSDVKFYSV